MESPMCGSTFYSITTAAIKKVCWIWRILEIKTEASALDSTTPSTTAYDIGHTERQKFTTHTYTERDSYSYKHTLWRSSNLFCMNAVRQKLLLPLPKRE